MPRTRLTDRWLKSHRPPRREEWSDALAPGLVVRFGERSPVFYLRLRHGSRMIRTRIGVYPELSLADARKRAHEAVVARDTSEDGSAVPGTFADLAAAFVRHQRAKGEARLDEVRRILETDVLPVIGDKRAAAVRRRDVSAILDAAIERGAPVQANRIRAHLVRVFAYGLERELVESNPAHDLKKPTKEKPRERSLSDTEIVALWRFLELRHPTTRHLFRFLLLTALRPGEARLLTWQDVDEWTLRIPAERTKPKREHRLPLSRLASLELDAQRSLALPGAIVFPSPKRPGEPFHPTSASHAAEKLSKALRFVLPFTPHDLRRTCATGLGALQVPRETIRVILNHADPDVTGRYDRHGREEEMRAALEAWAAHVQALLASVSDHSRLPAIQA